MIDLFVKILDFLLGGIIGKHKERVSVKNQFELIKRRIIYSGIANELPILLKELREFFIENNLVEKENFGELFSKWLNGPEIMLGIGAVNVFSRDEIMRFKNELGQLKL